MLVSLEHIFKNPLIVNCKIIDTGYVHCTSVGIVCKHILLTLHWFNSSVILTFEPDLSI